MKKTAFLLAGICFFAVSLYVPRSFAENVYYQVHVAGKGWLPTVQDGGTAGTTGESKRMEAIVLRTEGLPTSCKLTYQVHAADRGWMEWTAEGGLAGTTGEGRRLEAVIIKLDNCPGWSVEYQVHAADKGWMRWKKDGAIAGTTGQSRRIEAIKIRLRSVSNNGLPSTEACLERVRSCMINCEKTYPPRSYSVTTQRQFKQCKEQCDLDYYTCTNQNR